MIYALVEPLIVGIAVLSAAGFAWRRWRPSRSRSAGCGSGCGGCSSASADTGSACASHPAAGGPKALQTVAMPRSRRTSR